MTGALLLAVVLGGSSHSDAPVPATLRVSAEPNYVVLHGTDPRDVVLTTDVRDAHGAPVRDAALLSDATAGAVEAFQEVAPGRYQATLKRPAQAFPQVGVVTVFVLPQSAADPPLTGSAVVQYAADIDLHGHTEAGASMRVEVGGRTFGPVQADATGKFVLPVVVPPGAGTARGTSTDTLGNASVSNINLYLPALDRLHTFVYPRAPVADGATPAWIFVTCLSTSGAPQKGTLKPGQARGKLGAPVALGEGVWRLPYVPPTVVAPGHDTVHFASPLEAEEAIALAAGPPAQARLSVNAAELPADGSSTTVATLRVVDAHDNPTEGARVEATLDAHALVAAPQGVGTYTFRVPPRTRMGKSILAASVWSTDNTELKAPEVTLTWRMPTPVSVSLRVIERRTYGLTFRVDTEAAVADRLTLRASTGTLKRQLNGDWYLEVPVTASVDIIAQDAVTGVSALLRVPPGT